MAIRWTGIDFMTLHKKMPALFLSKLRRMRDNQLLFSRDVDHWETRLRNDPQSIQNKEIESLLRPSFRSQAWKRVKQWDKTLVVLHGPSQQRSMFLDRLKKQIKDTCVCSEAVTQLTTSQSLSNEELLQISEFLDAVEDDAELIAVDGDYSNRGPCNTFYRLSQLLGYEINAMILSDTSTKTEPVLTELDADVGVKYLVADDIETGIDALAQKQRIEAVEDVDGECIAFSAFLTARASTDLVRHIPPVHQHVYANCLTLVRDPNRHTRLDQAPLGTRIQLAVKATASNSEEQIAIAKVIGAYARIVPDADNLILLISSSRAAVAEYQFQSNELLSQATPVDQLLIEGVIGQLIAYPDRRPSRKLIHQDGLEQSTEEHDSNHITLDLDDFVVQRNKNRITELNVFDFDGTLISSPEEFVGRREYAEGMGVPYPYRGWFGRRESLSPPIRCLPGPAMRDYRSFFDRAGSWTVVLTGRLYKLTPVLEQVLETYNIEYDQFIAKRSSQDTCDFKASIILDLLQQFEGVKKIRIWDDNVENLVRFYQLKKQLRHRVDFEIKEAPYLPSPARIRPFSWEGRLYMNGTAAFLDAMRRSSDTQFWIHAEASIEFVASLWKTYINVDEILGNLCAVTGVYALGVQSHIDLHLLLPIDISYSISVDAFKSAVISKRIEHVTIKDQLQLKFYFSDCSPIRLRISFHRLNHPTKHPLPSLPAKDLDHLLDTTKRENHEVILFLAAQERISQLAKQNQAVLDNVRMALELIEWLRYTRSEQESVGDWPTLTQLLHVIASLIETALGENTFPNEVGQGLWLVKKMAALDVDQFLNVHSDEYRYNVKQSRSNETTPFLRLLKQCVDVVGLDSTDTTIEWTALYDMLLLKRH